ncbi:MAG: hypothetical protein ICV70_02430 [Jiangellaceae bacterium]|nr:hypothetical protein [Jiangellaceae bacterium]
MRKLLIILAVAFAVYFLLTAPSTAADAVAGVGSALAEGFQSVVTFFTELF